MAKMTKKDIEQRVKSIHANYANRFAGHPRATRDLAELDKIIKDANNLKKKSRSLQRHSSKELRTLIDERLDLYTTERTTILEFLAQGAEVREAAFLGSSANFLQARYHRHFAGHSRSTRDLELLEAAGIAAGKAVQHRHRTCYDLKIIYP